MRADTGQGETRGVRLGIKLPSGWGLDGREARTAYASNAIVMRTGPAPAKRRERR